MSWCQDQRQAWANDWRSDTTPLGNIIGNALVTFGKFFRVIFYVSAGYAIYYFGPYNISNVPLARLTLNDLFNAVIFVGISGGLIWLLFNHQRLLEFGRHGAFLGC
jgi:hypothetical protein